MGSKECDYFNSSGIALAKSFESIKSFEFFYYKILNFKAYFKSKNISESCIK